MRNLLWKITAFISVLLMPISSAFTQGLSGWLDITKENTENRQNGDLISENDTFNRIFYISAREPATPMMTYQLNLRSNWLDTNLTDSAGDTDTSYQRIVEPSIDLFLRNPMYDLSAGYRQQEQWSTAHLVNDGRVTTQFYYSRFDVTPEALPSLGFQFDSQKKYDHLPVSETDSTNSTYTVNSEYSLPSSDVKLRYVIDYSHTVNDTPLQTTTETIQDNFNGTFTAGYSRDFWHNRAGYSILYQGNYTRNKNEQTVPQTGIILNERLPFGGLYALGSSDDINELAASPLISRGSLVDDDQDNPSLPSINLSTTQYHNIGIFVSSSREVDRLYIYVNQDIGLENDLNQGSNWTVARSIVNQAGLWIDVPVSSVVTISPVDILNNIYRYEIRFVDPQSASFFKVINKETSSVAGVQVTEIEAYGEDNVEGMLLDVFSNYNQQLNFSVDVSPWDKWTFLFNYSIDRLDDNPESPLNSIGGMLENIFSDKIKEEHPDFSSNVTRNYSITSTWLTHRLFTTPFRLQRNETFDDADETDTSSNTYNLSFFSAPIPSVDASLTLIRHDSFNFDEKSTSNDSIVLSTGMELYRDVNMINDIGYTKVRSYVNGTSSSSRRLNGTIDALITKKLSSTLNYDFSWNESDGTSSRSSNHNITVTYRPGRFINLTGTLSYVDSNDETTTTEGILVDWLPLPAIRFNVNYQHSETDPGPSKSDSINSILTWYVTRFAELRTTYGYTKTVTTEETENINWKTSLNCRF
jgi:hypothetical protein